MIPISVKIGMYMMIGAFGCWFISMIYLRELSSIWFKRLQVFYVVLMLVGACLFMNL